MLKVFLVEDESIVREGLRDNIPWQQYGYEFVGEASDGEMALPLIQKMKPDVLLTDIKMPFMDGLSLSRLVHQEFPDMKIIIISGYDDFEYARGAEEKGFKVIIAGAGKAAHLPGMCAAIFPMPVIGIPMKTSDLGGVDSLYSIVQMPSGIPVATVAINGGANAGILAAKILATSDAELLKRLKACSEEMKQEVEGKAKKLDEMGYQAYLAQMR